MAEKDLPSNSDESDEDFVPDARPSSDEEDSTSAHSEDDVNEEQGPKSRKRRKVTKKKKKKEEENRTGEESEEKAEKVTDVEALWADFKEDVNKMEKQITSSSGKLDNKESSDAKNEEPIESNSKPSKQAFENKRSFPTMRTNSSKLGLNKILNQIGKKEKMSTLAKSQMDWNNFKKSEGIDEEIKLHNKGKDGYLDKQDFLQRTDLRQFEIEKQLRASRRNF